jgi:phosphoribosylformylglycinamidine synthase
VSPRVAVVVFPGSNCEQDVHHALRMEGADPTYVFHAETDLDGADAVILPGGFAHGDYLRTGAIARFSPVMDAVAAMAAEGKPVVGICNGFQILCEAGLVPGALMRNASLRFLCTWVEVVVEDTDTPMTRACERGRVLRIPINHYEGNYRPPAGASPRVVVRYVENPNGAWASVAGVANDAGNVVGMMPHPERASDRLFASDDGRLMFASLVEWCRDPAPV